MTRRLTCQDVVELATEYFEGSLPAAHSERFAGHVAGCRGCQAYLRQLRITVDIVHTAVDPEPIDRAALISAFRQWTAGGDVDTDSP